MSLTLSGRRRLWATWEEAGRRLAASEAEVLAFAQAGLRAATGVATLVITAVTGGPTVWTAVYEIPAGSMGVENATTLAAAVQQTVTQLEDPSSEVFTSFKQAGLTEVAVISLESFAVLTAPAVVTATATTTATATATATRSEPGGDLRPAYEDLSLSSGGSRTATSLVALVVSLAGGLRRWICYC